MANVAGRSYSAASGGNDAYRRAALALMKRRGEQPADQMAKQPPVQPRAVNRMGVAPRTPTPGAVPPDQDIASTVASKLGVDQDVANHMVRNKVLPGAAARRLGEAPLNAGRPEGMVSPMQPSTGLMAPGSVPGGPSIPYGARMPTGGGGLMEATNMPNKIGGGGIGSILGTGPMGGGEGPREVALDSGFSRMPVPGMSGRYGGWNPGGGQDPGAMPDPGLKSITSDGFQAPGLNRLSQVNPELMQGYLSRMLQGGMGGGIEPTLLNRTAMGF